MEIKLIAHISIDMKIDFSDISPHPSAIGIKERDKYILLYKYCERKRQH